MIPAQTFRIIVAFHNALWPLFFIAGLALFVYTWRRWQKGKFVLTWFVRAAEILLAITGFIVLYAYQFTLFYTLKGILALAMLFFFEKTRAHIQKQRYRHTLISIILFFLLATIVVAMSVYGR